MNKLITKIIGACLGMSMAAGVGIGVAVGSNNETFRPAEASFTPDTGYTAATMTAGTNGSACTVDGEDGIKVGTSSKGGNMSVTVPAGATDLRVYAAAWKGVTGLSLNISDATTSPTSIALTADDGISNNSPFTLSGSKSSFKFDISLSGIVSETTITFTSSIAKRFVLWAAQYKSSGSTTPTLTLNKSEMTVGLNGSDTFTVTAQHLTSTFTVTSNDTSKVTVDSISPAASSSDGVYTVTLGGEAITSSPVAVTVSSSGATSQTINVSVEELPVIDANLNTLSWDSTTYATSPHVLTMNSLYAFGVSAGQLNSSIGYLGTNGGVQSTVANEGFTMIGVDYSAINSVITAGSYWNTYGSAIRMLNFGILHPTSFSVTASTVGSIGASRAWYILASADSGSTWTVVENGSSIEANTSMTWSGNTYSSNSNLIQFAFVMTHSANKTISAITIKAYGDSIATTKVLDSISISGTPVTSYVVGQDFDVGEAVVYAHYTDSTTYPDENVTDAVTWSAIAHGTTEVTGTFHGKTVVVSVSVTDEGSIYKKIVSTNELIEGAKVVIGTSDGSYTAGKQGQNNRHPEAAGGAYGFYEDGDVENWSVNTAVFTIGITENGYTFFDGNGYLYAASSSQNYLRTEAELDENLYGEWSIAISDGVATIVSQGDHTHNTINGNGTAFGAYESPTVAISLYADVAGTVQAFINNQMHTDIDYDPDPTLPINNAGSCRSQSWYTDAKEVLVSLGSDYIDEFKGNSSFDNAQARYEAWALACGDTSPYAGTGIIPASETNIVNGAVGKNSTAIIIVVVSVLSLASFGAFFLLRKKKEVK